MLLPLKAKVANSLWSTDWMTKYDLLCISSFIWHPAYVEALEPIYCMCQCSLFSAPRVLQWSSGSGLHQPVRWEHWSNSLWMKKPLRSLRAGTKFLSCFERKCFILGMAPSCKVCTRTACTHSWSNTWLLVLLLVLLWAEFALGSVAPTLGLLLPSCIPGCYRNQSASKMPLRCDYV